MGANPCEAQEISQDNLTVGYDKSIRPVGLNSSIPGNNLRLCRAQNFRDRPECLSSLPLANL